MSFANPWLLLAAVVLFLPVIIESRQSPIAIADLKTLQIATKPNWRLRLSWIPGLLRTSALAILIVALARPQHGLVLTTLPEEGIDVVIALDVSGSMSQKTGIRTDSPNKLSAAREVIGDFIENLDNDRVGLVTFQSSTLLVSPLTLDHIALQRQLDNIESGMLTEGTAIGLGIAEALNLLRESPARSRIVVLLTDGENNYGEISPLQAARIAEALEVRVYTIGFHGTSTTSSQVDVQLLQQIASKTDANYFDASTQQELHTAYSTIRTLERSRIGERRFTEFNEFAPPLAVAVVLLLTVETGLRVTAFRRYP